MEMMLRNLMFDIQKLHEILEILLPNNKSPCLLLNGITSQPYCDDEQLDLMVTCKISPLKNVPFSLELIEDEVATTYFQFLDRRCNLYFHDMKIEKEAKENNRVFFFLIASHFKTSE